MVAACSAATDRRRAASGRGEMDHVMEATISLIVAVLALLVSGVTAWLTLLKPGTVRMTQPTVISIGARTQPSITHISRASRDE